jgi:predicted aldo/keto reductase-like oxidoreductase
MDYVDLFAFHGFAHFEAQMEWVFGKQPKDNSGGETEQGKETCLDVVREFIKAGKIRHLGFSSHGPPELIRRALESNVFDYVNLHNHYFGSYTNSGYGGTERGNADLMKLAHDKDLGSKCLYICCTVVNLVGSYAYWGLVCRCKSLSSVPTIKVASFTSLLENCVR